MEGEECELFSRVVPPRGLLLSSLVARFEGAQIPSAFRAPRQRCRNLFPSGIAVPARFVLGYAALRTILLSRNDETSLGRQPAVLSPRLGCRECNSKRCHFGTRLEAQGLHYNTFFGLLHLLSHSNSAKRRNRTQREACSAFFFCHAEVG